MKPRRAAALRWLAGVLAAPLLWSCASPDHGADGAASSGAPMPLQDLAIAYVKLVLALGKLDEGYVDAYYGPPQWQRDAEAQTRTAADIEHEATALAAQVNAASDPQVLTAQQYLQPLRREYLRTQLKALAARARMLKEGAKKLSFDEEALALYGVTPPHRPESDFDAPLQTIDELVPQGEGTLAERYNRYVERYAIPKARLERVMHAAIVEARRRTLAHMPLPRDERFELKLVSGKPWSAYNWYQGHNLSRIEVNTDLPVPVSRVIDLASHEGYPGHHVYNGLLEVGLVRDLGWPEFQVYALYSPQSLLAEGTADFGVELAFPGDEKLRFTKQLFKLAGFDPREAAAYLKVVTAARALAPAGIEAARRRLDGTASEEETTAFLQKYTLASPDKAKHAIAFMDHYRAYVINYSYGESLVRHYVESRGGTRAGSDGQWQAFFALVSQPHVPADLTAPADAPDPNPTVVTVPENAASGGTPLPGPVKDVPAFHVFITLAPTPEQFHARYPDVRLILPGQIATKEYRTDHSRYFAQLDAQGRIVGGTFK